MKSLQPAPVLAGAAPPAKTPPPPRLEAAAKPADESASDKSAGEPEDLAAAPPKPPQTPGRGPSKRETPHKDEASHSLEAKSVEPAPKTPAKSPALRQPAPASESATAAATAPAPAPESAPSPPPILAPATALPPGSELPPVPIPHFAAVPALHRVDLKKVSSPAKPPESPAVPSSIPSAKSVETPAASAATTPQAASPASALSATGAPAVEPHGVVPPAAVQPAAPVTPAGAAHVHDKPSASGSPASVAADRAAANAYPEETTQRMLVATPHLLEVGITGGAHGWLRVRAEMGHTGEVTASLVASNAGSASSLSKQAAAITDYLKTAAVGVTSFVVTAPEKAMSAPGTAAYPSSGADAGPADEGSRGDRPHPQAEGAAASSKLAGGGQPATFESPPLSPAFLSGPSGGWLNVMA